MVSPGDPSCFTQVPDSQRRESAVTYAHAVNKVTISGTCFGGAEIWSTGFFVGLEDGDAGEVTAPQCNAIADHWEVFFEHAQSEVSWAWLTTEVKMAKIDTLGETVEDEVEYYTYPAAIAGGKQSNGLPPQVSIVATLQSSNVRGLASKGRMFLPGLAPNIGQFGKIDAAQLGVIATNINNFLSAVNDDFAIPGQIILASFGSVTAKDASGKPTGWGPGENKFVEHVRLGDVFDTQRRRRNALNETYINRDVSQG